jgi:hypothetical protein
VEKKMVTSLEEHKNIVKKDEDLELSDIDYFEAELGAPKVDRQTAIADFRRFIVGWKLTKKALKKARSGKRNKERREEYQESHDTIINAIMYGNLVIASQNGKVVMEHHLHEPCGSHDILTYSKIPKVVDLRKMDEFGEDQNFAQLQALAAAMSGKAVPELGKLSASDIDIIGAIFYFFV